MPQLTSDVVIIGGGIAGLSLAAAVGGRLRVLLVEAEDTFAFHTSSRSAQQMQPTYGPAEIRAITRASITLVHGVESAMGTRILSPRPLLWCGFGDTTVSLSDLVADIPGVSELTTARALEMLPVLRSHLLAFAGIDRDACQVNVAALLRWYEREAERRGATLLTASPVTRATRSGNSWIVTAGDTEISTAVVVNAAGAWADTVAGIFGQPEKGLHPYRRTVLIGDTTGAAVDPEWPMVNDSDKRFYFRPDGVQLLASPMEDVITTPQDARPERSDIDTILARVNAVTTLDLVESRAWTGLRTLSEDGLPVIGWGDSDHSFYWLAGQGGYGIQTSTAIAKFVAAQLAGETAELPNDAVVAFVGLQASRITAG